MTWNLQTSILEKINLESYRALPFFSSRSGNPPVAFSTLNPQAKYFTLSKKPDFVPVEIQEIPSPTLSNLYVFNGLVDASSLTQVFNINLIDTESYFQDVIEGKTYIFTSNSSLVLKGFVELTEDEFFSSSLGTELNLSYTFEDLQNYTITKITSEGLVYLPGVSGDHTFSFDGTELLLRATTTCAPRKNKGIILETTLSIDSASEVYNVWVFNLSDFNLSAVDSFTWMGKSFNSSLDVAVGSLLYNRISKVLISVYG